jgi:hypothetical protein
VQKRNNGRTNLGLGPGSIKEVVKENVSFRNNGHNGGQFPRPQLGSINITRHASKVEFYLGIYHTFQGKVPDF